MAQCIAFVAIAEAALVFVPNITRPPIHLPSFSPGWWGPVSWSYWLLSMAGSIALAIGAGLCLRRTGRGPQWLAYGAAALVAALAASNAVDFFYHYRSSVFPNVDYHVALDVWNRVSHGFLDAALPLILLLISARSSNAVFLAGERRD